MGNHILFEMILKILSLSLTKATLIGILAAASVPKMLRLDQGEILEGQLSEQVGTYCCHRWQGCAEDYCRCCPW